MRLVTKTSSYEELIKKSRFIGLITPCQSEQQALNWLRQLHEQHPNASHIVYAYRIQSEDGLICRFHDAGEPSGTAGKPIFQHLEGKQLINLCLAVIRYFGGVKLGAGGLTRAYSNTAKYVIEAADLIDYIEYAELGIELSYAQLQGLEYQLKKLDGTIISQEFADLIKLRLRLPKQNLSQLQAYLN